MLPRQYRLPATIRLKDPDTYATPYFLVKLASNNLTHSRFGFIIGKAAAKEAVKRNRARRLLRSCIEERLSGITGGVDMLFLLKKGIIDKDRQTLTSEIAKLLSVKKLIRESQNHETTTT